LSTYEPPGAADLTLVDADVLLGHYPFRRFPYPHHDPAQVKDYLQARGIARACVSSLHALFYPDPQQGNDEHLPGVVRDDFFLPVAVVNPALPAWRRGLARSRQEYGVRLVRLAPAYHSYDLADPQIVTCIQEMSDQGLLVGIVKRIEDERMHPPLMKVPGVDNGALLTAAEQVEQPLLVYGAYFGELAELAAAPNLHFDIAFVETMDTLARVAGMLPASRLLFSSHAPFFYPEAAISKVQRWQTAAAARAQVAGGTLAALLGMRSPA
jgi:hypothetical protein